MASPGPILIASYHFTPAPATRGLQVAKLLKYALRAGATIEIVTAPNGAPEGTSHDPGVPWFPPDERLTVHRVASRVPRAFDRASSLLTSRPLRSWGWAAQRCCLDLLASRGAQAYACLMTCAMPIDSHAPGLAAKRVHPRLPWLAHFSDPYANNPLYPPRGFWQAHARRRFENRVVGAADRLLFVGDGLREHVMGLHPVARDKARTLFHVFDPELYGDATPTDEDVLTVTYLGGLAKRRNIEPLLRVLEHLKATGAPLERLRFRMVGDELAESSAALNAIVPGAAAFVGRVSYLESLRLMREADLLLLIDANVGASPFYPSKLADYFGAGRPVLAITPPYSYSTVLLREAGMPCFGYEELEACADWLARQVRGETTLPSVRKEALARFEAPAVARRFLDLVAEVAGEQ